MNSNFQIRFNNVDVTSHVTPSRATPVAMTSDRKASEVALRATADELNQILRDTLGRFGVRSAAFRKLVSSDVDDDAHLMVVTQDRLVRASARPEMEQDDALWLDIGCVAKLLTGTTFLSVFRDDPTILKANAEQLLGVGGPQWFSEACIEDLLNHTHGLDVSHVRAAPTLSDGKIDVAKLLTAAGERLLAPPGAKLYSYSSAGVWLLAAILEKKLGLRFIDVIRQVFPKLLPPPVPDDRLCPANGRGVRVNGEQLLMELSRATTASHVGQAPLLKLDPSSTVLYPGWHPLEKGVCRGWKVYPNEWYGHQAILSRTPMMLRFRPSDGLGFLISSRSIHPLQILSAVFSPEYTGGFRTPPAPARVGAGSHDLVHGVWVFERAESRVQIRIDESGWTMEFVPIYRSQPQREPKVHTSTLVPLAPGLFKASWPTFGQNAENTASLLQWVRDSTGRVTHLWNGGLLWRRVA
jgi:hypothetical protein